MTKPQPALPPVVKGDREPGSCPSADLTPYRECFPVVTRVSSAQGAGRLSQRPRPTLASRQPSSQLWGGLPGRELQTLLWGLTAVPQGGSPLFGPLSNSENVYYPSGQFHLWIRKHSALGIVFPVKSEIPLVSHRHHRPAPGRGSGLWASQTFQVLGAPAQLSGAGGPCQVPPSLSPPAQG